MGNQLQSTLIYSVLVVVMLIAPSSAITRCLCDTSANYALLMDFYGHTSCWLNSSGWGDPSVLICDWYGITCTGEDVVKVNLQANNITGTLPPSGES